MYLITFGLCGKLGLWFFSLSGEAICLLLSTECHKGLLPVQWPHLKSAFWEEGIISVTVRVLWLNGSAIEWIPVIVLSWVLCIREREQEVCCLGKRLSQCGKVYHYTSWKTVMYSSQPWLPLNWPVPLLSMRMRTVILLLDFIGAPWIRATASNWNSHCPSIKLLLLHCTFIH